MTTEQKQLILATVPLLKEQGLALTKHFYNRMFSHHPELKNIFNMGNQQSGKQQTALANAVLAYAENIQDPSVLMPAIQAIGHKHASLDIRPEQYMIVGRHLIASIAEVLGNAATQDILDAWRIAYEELAHLLSGYEAGLYREQMRKPHSWSGWRLFRITGKEMESAEICSFYLSPADGGNVPFHQPGQYISIKMLLPDLNMHQIRQYSISSAPSQTYYRISVKRERSISPPVQGMISNHLHDGIETGSFVEVSAPAGNFVLPEQLDAPLVFISGGVGATPLMSMLEHLIQQNTVLPITWVHGCRNEQAHAFRNRINSFASKYEQLKAYTFYDQCTEKNKAEQVLQGVADLQLIRNWEHAANARYFICGPTPFIEKQFRDLKQMGIAPGNILFEEFGPQLLHLN